MLSLPRPRDLPKPTAAPSMKTSLKAAAFEGFQCVICCGLRRMPPDRDSHSSHPVGNSDRHLCWADKDFSNDGSQQNASLDKFLKALHKLFTVCYESK